MANVTDRVAQIRGARHGKDVRESFATCIEDMNAEVGTATGNYADAQAAADEALSKAGPAVADANEAATAANTAAGAANTAAGIADEKSSKIVSEDTLNALGLSVDGTPDDAFNAIVELLGTKLSNEVPVPVENGGTGAANGLEAFENLKLDTVGRFDAADEELTNMVEPGTSKLFKLKSIRCTHLGRIMQVTITVNALSAVNAGNITNQFIGKFSDFLPYHEVPLCSGSTGAALGHIATNGDMYIDAILDTHAKGFPISLGATFLNTIGTFGSMQQC